MCLNILATLESHHTILGYEEHTYFQWKVTRNKHF